jgi:hypothetical protein
VICVLAARGFLRKLPEAQRIARPTYVRLGILPDPNGTLSPQNATGAAVLSNAAQTAPLSDPPEG